MDHLTRRLSSKTRSSTNGSANGMLEAAAEGGLVHPTNHHGHAPSQQSSQATTMRLRPQSSNTNNSNTTATVSALRGPGGGGLSRKRQKGRGRRRRILSRGGPLCSVVTSFWDSIHHRTNRFLRRHPERLPWLVASILMTTLAVCLCATMVFQQRTATSPQSGGLLMPLNLFGRQRRRSQQLRRWSFAPFEVIFPRKVSVKPSKTFHTERGLAHDVTWIPPVIDGVDATNGMYVDYGGLKFTLFQEPGAVRQIGKDNKAFQTHFRDYDTADKDDDQDAYFALDDDVERNEFASRKVEGHPEGLQCRRVHEHRFNFPNCNTFHETAMLEWGVTYLGEGSYRQVVGLEHDVGDEMEAIALKDYHYNRDFTIEGYEYVRMDATVAERLTSSPHIYDIYGFCGLGIMSEWFEHGDIEPMVVPGNGYLNVEERKMEQGNPLKSHNDFTPFQKLQMSLQMAEGLADLHGNVGGVIVHQDVQLSQYLFNSDKSVLKLNDFNRAEFMLWNEEKHEYCKYTEFVGHGNWRSPEEYFDNPLNEQVDVFSVGNNMYSLLTGLWVFYDEQKTSTVQKRVKKGEMAYIDPRYKERSVEEAKLAEAIHWCHQFLPEDRPSIFQLVEFLRKAVEEASKGLENQQ